MQVLYTQDKQKVYNNGVVTIGDHNVENVKKVYHLRKSYRKATEATRKQAAIELALQEDHRAFTARQMLDKSLKVQHQEAKLKVAANPRNLPPLLLTEQKERKHGHDVISHQKMHGMQENMATIHAKSKEKAKRMGRNRNDVGLYTKLRRNIKTRLNMWQEGKKKVAPETQGMPDKLDRSFQNIPKALATECRACGLKKRDIRNMKRHFLTIDVDGSGTIDVEEFYNWVDVPPNAFLAAMFEETAQPGGEEETGLLTFPHMVVMLKRVCTWKQREVINYMFNVLDEDNSETISECEFLKLVVMLRDNQTWGGNVLKMMERAIVDEHEVTLEMFHAFVRKYPIALVPMIHIQQRMQRTSLGVNRWLEVMAWNRRKAEVCEYRRKKKKWPKMTVGELLQWVITRKHPFHQMFENDPKSLVGPTPDFVLKHKEGSGGKNPLLKKKDK